MPARCCWPRWLTPMPANMPTIAISPSAPESSAISRDIPAPLFWRCSRYCSPMKPYRAFSTRFPSASTRRSRLPCLAWRSISRAPGYCPAAIITGTTHGHGHDHDHGEEPRRVELGTGALDIEVFEDNVPPRFRVRADLRVLAGISELTLETIRPDGGRQLFTFENRSGYLQSRDEIPEPHAFLARVRLVQDGQRHERELTFEEHDHEAAHGAHHRDNNMRAAVIHVMDDGAVSILVIAGLLLARAFGWLW